MAKVIYGLSELKLRPIAEPTQKDKAILVSAQDLLRVIERYKSKPELDQ